MRYLIILLAICTIVVAQQKKARQAASENLGDDYSDFSAQPVKNAGANHDLKQVTYSTIAPKFDIPTRAPLLNPNPIGQRSQTVQTTTKRPVVDYRRGYYFQHYPWDRLPRRYLLRPGMTYVYPPQFHGATYRYPYLPYTDHYSIYRTHPGIGSGCGGGGCGGGGYGGYAQAYQGYGGYSSGCGGGSGTGCGGYDDDNDDESYEDSEEEGGKSGEAKINKKDPLEDLELEDLEKLSKSDDAKVSASSDSTSDDADLESEPIEIKKSKSKHLDDEDLIDDRKKAKRNFLIKWA